MNDETMENVNMWMKGLPLSPSIESWQFHSPNIVLAKRCDNYVKMNNKRGKVDTENSTVESGLGEARLSALKEKKTVVPSYQIEKSRLFELIVNGLESGNNTFITQDWIQLIDKLSLPLNDKNELLDPVVEEGGELEMEQEFNSIFNNNDEAILDDVPMNVIDNDDNNDDNMGMDNIQSNIATKSDCHRFGLCDIITAGKNKMTQKQFIKKRKLKVILEKRNNSFYESVYIDAKSRENNRNVDNDITKLHRIVNGHVNLTKTEGMDWFDKI